MTLFTARVLSAVLAASWLPSSGTASGVAAPQAERTDYYAIAGSSARELRAAMNEKRPVGKDGRPHDAITSWYVRWRYTTTGSSGSCGVKSFDVSLEISMTFPRWTNESAAAPELVQQWRTYYANLAKHEEGHRAIGLGAAADIREAGSKLPPPPDCSELGREVEKVMGDILERYRQRERDYDRDTDHGRTQGARFP